jgi:hypothetical protein
MTSFLWLDHAFLQWIQRRGSTPVSDESLSIPHIRQEGIFPREFLLGRYFVPSLIRQSKVRDDGIAKRRMSQSLKSDASFGARFGACFFVRFVQCDAV